MACSLPGVCDFRVGQEFGRLVKAARASVQPCGVAGCAAGGAARQRFAGGMRVGDAAEGEACTGLARGAVHQRAFRIDRDEAAGGIDWRLAELQREVERLAEQDDEVHAADQVVEGAEGRVVEASRAFHDAGGDLQRCFEARQQRAAGTVRQMRAGDQQRTRRAGDDVQDRVGRRVVQCDGRGGEVAWLGPHRGVVGDVRIEQVGGKAQMHRTGTAGGGDADRLRDVGAERLGRRRGP